MYSFNTHKELCSEQRKRHYLPQVERSMENKARLLDSDWIRGLFYGLNLKPDFSIKQRKLTSVTQGC